MVRERRPIVRDQGVLRDDPLGLTDLSITRLKLSVVKNIRTPQPQRK